MREVVAMSNKAKESVIGDYCAGHPWFYVRGNKVLTPKQIKQDVMQSEYRGYLKDEILAIDKQAEPKRTEKLNKLRQDALQYLKSDLSRYRQCAFELHRFKKIHGQSYNPVSCDDIHTSIGLVHNHIYNRFAHLILLDELDTQLDMFA